MNNMKITATRVVQKDVQEEFEVDERTENMFHTEEGKAIIIILRSMDHNPENLYDDLWSDHFHRVKWAVERFNKAWKLFDDLDKVFKEKYTR